MKVDISTKEFVSIVYAIDKLQLSETSDKNAIAVLAALKDKMFQQFTSENFHIYR